MADCNLFNTWNNKKLVNMKFNMYQILIELEEERIQNNPKQIFEY